jgi:hypothetical protein
MLNTSYAESEDEWPSVHALLQGVELTSSSLPPPPRHLVHAGFVREGESAPEGYWIGDVLLLLFKDFLLVACQPKTDFAKVSCGEDFHELPVTLIFSLSISSKKL